AVLWCSFFLSSRRRHTRFSRDWSSDVCSSDLARADDGTSITGADEYEQSQVIFTKIRNLVEAAGAEMDDVVKMTIYVTNMSHNDQVWKARREFFSGDFPACTLVEVSALAKPEILVEIEAIAIAGSY